MRDHEVERDISKYSRSGMLINEPGGMLLVLPFGNNQSHLASLPTIITVREYWATQ
jgi:hypothetical protein